MAAAVYDIESVLDDLGTFLAANLNTKLSYIDSEKADGITLTQFDADAFFYQDLGDRVANYNPVCIYGVESATVTGLGPATAKKLVVQVLVLYSDQGNDPDLTKKLYRYQRAILELVEKNWVSIANGVEFLGASLFPVDFVTLRQRHSPDRIIGMSFELNLP